MNLSGLGSNKKQITAISENLKEFQNKENIDDINTSESNLFKTKKVNDEIENVIFNEKINNLLTLRKNIVKKKLEENINEKYFIVNHMKKIIDEVFKKSDEKQQLDSENVYFMIKENHNIIELLNFLIYLIYSKKIETNFYIEVLDIIEFIFSENMVYNIKVDITLNLNKCENILLILNKFLVDSIFIDNKIICESSFVCLNLIYNKIYEEHSDHYYYNNEFFNQIYDLLSINTDLNYDNVQFTTAKNVGSMVLFYNILRVECRLFSRELNQSFVSSNLKYFTDKIIDFHKLFKSYSYEYFLFMRAVMDIYSTNDYFIKNMLELSLLEDIALEAVNSDNLKVGEISAEIFYEIISLNISLDYILNLIAHDYIYHLIYLLYHFIADEEIVVICFRSIVTYLKYEDSYNTDTLRISLYKYDTFKLVEKLIEICENCTCYNDNLEIESLSKKIKDILVS